MQFVVDRGRSHRNINGHFIVLFIGHDEAKIQMFGSRKIIINVVQLRDTVATVETLNGSEKGFHRGTTSENITKIGKNRCLEKICSQLVGGFEILHLLS